MFDKPAHSLLRFRRPHYIAQRLQVLLHTAPAIQAVSHALRGAFNDAAPWEDCNPCRQRIDKSWERKLVVRRGITSPSLSAVLCLGDCRISATTSTGRIIPHYLNSGWMEPHSVDGIHLIST